MSHHGVSGLRLQARREAQDDKGITNAVEASDKLKHLYARIAYLRTATPRRAGDERRVGAGALPITLLDSQGQAACRSYVLHFNPLPRAGLQTAVLLVRGWLGVLVAYHSSEACS